MIHSVLTNRNHQTWASWDIVYEWEDYISRELGLPLVPLPVDINSVLTRLNDRLSSNRLYRWLRHRKTIDAKPALVFHMRPHRFVPSFHTPIIIDFWKHQNIDQFVKAYQSCPLILVSSREAYEFLIEKKCPLRLYHWPLSLPDKHLADDNALPKKDIDVIQAGRSNPVFDDYMERFLKNKPNTHYVYRKSINNKLVYYSTKHGNLNVGESRDEYFDLLARSKIALYSSPGVDGGTDRTGGFNPITPRLLESIAKHCHVLARYIENSDVYYYGVQDKCPNIATFAQFSLQIERLLSEPLTERDKANNKSFLAPHLSKMRVSQLKEILTNASID